ncbi:4-hydroxy-tetrahydrodipicolinate synthase [Candidatus Poribacteria bacterium]|jgi:4-hydroxy-tetrahydrodipicolinate synthase|nr:4-hydroxy-tetrahydrodipicolinate synthase [Candidatus Poribacteria bacterium]MBT5533116.1 4-hydroxy-tetrahydrodipicolinate synthase [Candidatus Poribacteria bacterium]MBT5713151.1 4-hydroxy-tetrahydrodipicolinate synthase [Candidatus Poribacteria bacterium]MBT7097914.1 4-hydroxy-tetrahydrodipicolinate synthase [Candidatus Poribacteria bacterium]MBT7805559.1 4-hydroxy-tetrahydrodipicolinate synthase [Candidatus Poribacteria bacterium]
MFRGSYVALVTPFQADGDLDLGKLRDLIEFQIENGTHGIVPCGTTGESPTLSHDEHDSVVEETVKAVDGRVQVIAGAGSNSTAEALRLTRHAKAVGADGALVITPYYNKPTQEGLVRHFTTVADEVDIPIVMYNVPGRTGSDMLAATVGRVAGHPNIAAIKEATGDLRRTSEVIAACRGEEFVVLSGEDSVTFPMMSLGGKGVISVVANVDPKRMAQMCDAFESGDYGESQRLHYELLPLACDLFIETNPIPAKTSLEMMGMLNGVMRLPLCEMGAENVIQLRATLEISGLL